MNRRFLKPLAVFMALNMLTELCFPTIAFALTGGPSQPEMESFEPVGTTDMVDLFTGDFNYNIPLVDVGGYPINIAYHSGVTMDQEASWVGLGWNINAGVINRITRGLPDDFNADEIKTETNIKENITWSLFSNFNYEFMGLNINKNEQTGKTDTTLKNTFGAGLNLGVTHNNYRGLGYFFGTNFNIPFNNAEGKNAGGMRLGFTGNSQGGFEYDVSYTRRTKGGYAFGGGIGMGSRTGMKALVNASKTKDATRTKAGKDSKFENGEGQYTQGLYNNSIPISAAAELPTVNQSFNTYIQNYNLTVGLEFFGMHGNVGLGGSYSKTAPVNKTLNRRAFGYLYAFAAGSSNTENNDVLHDFSRERDGSLSQYAKNLPVSSSSYDVLSVSGQGTGGMFRPHLSNVGVYFDNKSENYSSNLATLGIEIGALTPTGFHIGLNYTPTVSNESSGAWENGNTLSGVAFNWVPGKSPNLELYERYYFQSGGEKVPTDSIFNKKMGGDAAVRLNIDRSGMNYYSHAFTTLENDYGSVGGMPLTHDSVNRQIRSQHINTLTVKESRSGIGFMPQLRTYPNNYFEMTNPTSRALDRLSNTPAKDHHMGEFIQTNPDGTRYVYAIPAYNNYQREVSFAAAGNAATPAKGLVSYAANLDNTSGNKKGQDNFYNKVETPGSAHSYLLTAVLSADYADTDQDGQPSEGDIGQYVKFNYTRHDSDYKWRAPFEKNMAQFQEGLKSDPVDNKGNYVYGSKEIWYLQSIESRTHIAEFKMSPRFDGFGVTDENGGADLLRPLMKLDTIVLYSRPDRLQNKGAATPVKKVVFEYNYSLCRQIPNNKYYGQAGIPADSTGKLTLKKLYFLYGNSGKGSMSPYKFTYDETANFNYSMADYDRWGNYKPNNETLANRDFPYTDQTVDSTTADKRAGAWSMSRIDLPSGGFIQATYESDDYAFVQDRKAMQMLQIVAATDDASLSTFKLGKDKSNFLYTNQGSNRRNYLVFKLPGTFANDADLRNRCFKNIDNLYFKFLLNIKGKYEYISGWCQINKNHIGILSGDQSLGYVEVKTVKQGDVGINMNADVNAISKTAWQFAIANMSRALHPGSDPNGTGVGAFQGLIESFSEALDMYRGQYQALKNAGVASEFVASKSWIRVESPTMFKYGGGCRVKQLAFNDSWSQMDVNDKFAQYEQVYDYTVYDDAYGLISSGVASYEPMIGGEENPFRLPIKYMQNTNPALPALELFNEEPYGESLLPPPVVGYSKVSVRNKPKTGAVRTGTGHTEYEFYTARDFPVEFQNTQIHPESLGAGVAGSIISAALKVVTMSSYAMSQGYVVKLNDMHGKPRATSTFSEMDQSPTAPVMLSRVSYQYQVKNGKLNNQVQVLNNLGKIQTAEIGKEMDVSIDMRQNERWEINGGLQVNAKFDLAGFLPIAYAIPWPTFKYSLNRMQAACVTKVIQQYGILETTTVQDEGSMITTKNLLYDKATGQVLLTQTLNTFDDPIYNFTYPAHMAYDGMEGAYQNTGLFRTFPTSNGVATIGNHGLYVEGDELMVTDNTTGVVFRGWVLKVVPSGVNDLVTIIRADGSLVPNPATIYLAKTMRSGRRNMTSLPVSQVTSTTNPISGDSIRMGTATIAQATANTFNQRWQPILMPKISGLVFEVGCEYIPDTFVAQTFWVLADRIRADRAVHSGSIVPYNLAGLGWFTNGVLDKKTRTVMGNYDSLFTMISDTALSNFGAPPASRTTWYNTDSMFFYLYSKTGASYAFKGGLKIYSPSGCLFKNIDTIFSVRPYADSSGTRGNAYARMLNGDTCMFVYTPINGGLFDVPGKVKVNCVTDLPCQYAILDTVNPYLVGAKGAWRPQKTMAFVEDLQYTYKGDTTFIRKDGVYKSFVPYWSFSTTGTLQESIDKRWIPASTITNYHPKGNAGEAKDALGNYSAELYGYNERFVTASSSFARLCDIGNDNFEDYTSLDNSCTDEGHWDFQHGGTTTNTNITTLPLIEPEDAGVTYSNVFVTKKQAHTGVQSLCVPPGYTRKISRPVDTANTSVVYTDPIVFSANVYTEQYVANTFPRLMPQPGKKYYISAWVKGRAIDINQVNTYDSAWMRVQAGGASPLNVKFLAKGPIIEGWQRIEGSFTIPATADFFYVWLENTARYKAYFDDIRIHPFESNMKTFVYDPVLLKVMATLDENNFASFYEYDKEGKLIRIKKETEKGVMTIQESRGSKSKVIHP